MRISSIQWNLPIGLMIVATAAITWADDVDKRAPVPSKDAQSKAMKLVKEVYGGDWENATTATQKKAFAKRVLDQAGNTNDDLTSKYVLLNVCKSVALQAVDAETALAAIDRMAQSFAIDAMEMKTSALGTLLERDHTASDSESIAALALVLQSQAVAEDKLDAAVELCKAAVEEAGKTHKLALIRKARVVLTANQDRWQASTDANAALATLAKTPDDPQANLAAGKYLCFFKGDWDKGISMLALGKDAELSGVAQKDLAGAKSRDEQVRLGDSWWSVAEDKEGMIKSQLLQRSAFWYQKALPQLSGLLKDKVVLRLAEIAKQPKEEASITSAVPLAGKVLNNRHVKLPVSIVRAEWGGGKKWANVTPKVMELLDKGANISASCDCLKADPTPGWRKKLKIEYIKNGQRKTLWLDEGKKVDSPDFKN